MEQQLRRLLATPDRPADETKQLARILAELLDRPDPPDDGRWFPAYRELHDSLREAVDAHRPEHELEERCLELYAHLHMHEAPYTVEERRLMDASGGYWAHAGGLSPILKAGPYIGSATVSMDLGAGNGLQGLLLQLLYPHRRTIQVEISSRMVDIGRRLQHWLGIDRHRVQWVVGDVLETAVAEVDFLYLYRPVKPLGPGRDFYRRLARELENTRTGVVVFSVADCLRHELSPGYELLHFDGHLSCMRVGGSQG